MKKIKNIITGIIFFTISQATDSIKNLLYFMGFGNSIIEIVNNIELRKNAVESSPNHFVSEKIVTGNSVLSRLS